MGAALFKISDFRDQISDVTRKSLDCAASTALYMERIGTPPGFGIGGLRLPYRLRVAFSGLPFVPALDRAGSGVYNTT